MPTTETTDNLTPAPSTRYEYICMYKRSSITITAQSSFHAQREAARIFKAKKPWDVTVTLHCKDGTPVPFDPAGL